MDINICSFKLYNNFQGMRYPLIVVYFNAKDFSNKYIARLWDLNKPTKIVMEKDTIEEIQANIPEHMTKIPRSELDDPVIVEVYI